MFTERNYINEIPDVPVKKTYVSVRAYFNKEGMLSPEVIIWEDGREFRVDRVLEMRPSASLKSGGCGTRYTCRIRGREVYLFIDGKKWFVERK